MRSQSQNLFTQHGHYLLQRNGTGWYLLHHGTVITHLDPRACDLEMGDTLWGDSLALTPRAAAQRFLSEYERCALMSKSYTFEVPGKPVPAPRMTRVGKHVRKHAKRSQIDAYFSQKELIGWHAKAAGAAFLTGPIHMELDIYVADLRRRDSKNILSSCEDALSGICYKDDSQICSHIIRKFLDRENPRMIITLTELEPHEHHEWGVKA